MTQHPHHVDHHHHRRPEPHDQQRFLDLDAEVFGDQLAEVLDLAGVSSARSVVDLGAGSGAGSRLLRERYPHAALTCVDNDPQMLALLRDQGFTVVEGDLDLGFPTWGAAPPVDLVWASSSLHHVSHPAELLAGIRDALSTVGVVVISELATLPFFLSDPEGTAVEQRCHAIAAIEGWNHYPDWTPVIEAAGFDVVTSRVTHIAPVTAAAREYGRQWFERFTHLSGLTQNDRNMLQSISFHDETTELTPRSTRTVWVGKPRHR